jgi:hypothetical protein
MTLPELHALLDRLGIVLSVRGDRLHYQAPPGVMTPEVRTALADHKPALLADPPPPPDRGWRACIAYWPVEWRQRWADRSEARQADGDPWDIAEWSAFVATVAEIAAAEARGERIPFADPPEGLSDADALAAMERITWDGTSLAESLEEARRLDAASTSTPRRKRP